MQQGERQPVYAAATMRGKLNNGRATKGELNKYFIKRKSLPAASMLGDITQFLDAIQSKTIVLVWHGVQVAPIAKQISFILIRPGLRCYFKKYFRNIFVVQELLLNWLPPKCLFWLLLFEWHGHGIVLAVF